MTLRRIHPEDPEDGALSRKGSARLPELGFILPGPETKMEQLSQDSSCFQGQPFPLQAVGLSAPENSCWPCSALRHKAASAVRNEGPPHLPPVSWGPVGRQLRILPSYSSQASPSLLAVIVVCGPMRKLTV